MLDGGQIAGLIAGGVFAICVVALRLVPRRESRVVCASPRSTAMVTTSPGHPSPWAGGRQSAVPDRGPAPGVANDDPPFRMQMNAHAHAVEFVRWMRDMGLAGRYSAADVGKYYDWFTRDQRVFPIPSVKFLEALNKHPGVGKKRDRIKDENGNVPKLASGSPMRTMFYTIADEPAAHVPAGVRALPERPRKPRATPATADVVAGFERKAA